MIPSGFSGDLEDQSDEIEDAGSSSSSSSGPSLGISGASSNLGSRLKDKLENSGGEMGGHNSTSGVDEPQSVDDPPEPDPEPVDSPATRNPGPAGVSPSTNVKITAEEGTEEDPGVQATTLSGQGANTATEAVATDAVHEEADDPVHTEQVNVGATGMEGIEALEDWGEDVTGNSAEDAQTPETEDGGLGLWGVLAGLGAIVLAAVAVFGGDDEDDG